MTEALLTRARPRAFLKRDWWRKFAIGLPFLWLSVFFLLPFFFIMKLSVAESEMGIPPFSPLISQWVGWLPTFDLHWDSFGYLTEDWLYASAYLNSLKTALITTIGCVLIGYPMAYAIVTAPPRRRPLLLTLIIMPFWTSFLIRVYAWIAIIRGDGLINQILHAIGFSEHAMTLMYTPAAVYIVMVYAYLPLFLLPLYAQLEKLDMTYIEAANDLGARPASAFLFVTLPLSLPGIVAGCMLVFIPAVGEYIIPTLIGDPGMHMISMVVWDEFFQNNDWPTAAALALIVVGILLVPLVIFQWARGRMREGTQ